MQYTIKNNKEFRYKSDEKLFAGLVIMETDKDSCEILETYEKYIDSVLEKCAEVKYRSENDIINEVIESCAASIYGLDYDKASDILNAFTTFFLYDLSTKRFVISRNIVYEELNGTVVVSTKNEGIHLVEFIPQKDKDEDTKKKDEEIKRVIIIILKRITKITAVLICAALVVLYGAKKLYEHWIDDHYDAPKGISNEEEVVIYPTDSVVSLKVVNELATNGRLYVEEDSSLIIKYFVTKDMTINENTIDWNLCPLLNRTDTLYPKGNCLVFLRATLRDGNKEIYSQEKASFNFNSYIEQLIMTNLNLQRTNEILLYSFNRPLTICYDNATEDICEKSTDKGIIDNLRVGLTEGEYHIDSVAFYSNTDIMKDILSDQYPQLKYLGCSSN